MRDISNEEIFLLVVETGSFKGAAEALNMNPSLISRRIASLEKRLQVKLFERSTKKSSATDQGFSLYKGLKHIYEEKSALEKTITGMTNVPSGHLKIAAPHDFGTTFVMAVLQKMADDYDELSIELVLGSQYENLREQNIDVAVRVGELKDSSLICRKINQVPRVLVASKSYIEMYGEPLKVEDLQHHKFILYKKAHTNEVVKVGSQTLSLKGRFIANSVTAIKQLVLSGSGIHLGPEWAFKKDIQNGNVLKLLPQESLKSAPLNAVYVSKYFLPAKIRVFIDLLIKEYNGGEF